MFSINFNFFKKYLLFLMIFYLFMPNVVCVRADESNTGNEIDKTYDGFRDLDGLHIEMDTETGEVFIPEVKQIQSNGSKSVQDAFNFAYGEFQSVIIGFSGVCTLTFVLIFLVTFVKIGASDSNPQKKAELSKALLWIGLGAAGFGSVTLILGLAFGLFV